MEPPQIPTNGDQVYAYPICERRVFQEAVIETKQMATKRRIAR